jgi:hypothetical protein
MLMKKDFSWGKLMEIKLPAGLLIFFVVVSPWYVLVGVHTEGEWLRRFFLEHNVERFTSTMEGHGGFPLASLVIAVVALIPFSFFSPQAIVSAWRLRKSDDLQLFSLIVVGVVVFFFALSRTILPNYPEPAVPFFAILLGSFLAGPASQHPEGKRLKLSALLWLVFSLLLPVAAWIALGQDESLSGVSYLSVFFLLLPAGAILGCLFIRKGKMDRAVMAYAVSSMLFIIVFFYVMFPIVDRLNPVTQAVAKIDNSLGVYYYRAFNPAFIINLKRAMPSLTVDELATLRGEAERDFYLVTQERFLDDLHAEEYELVFRGKDLFETHTTVVLRHRD